MSTQNENVYFGKSGIDLMANFDSRVDKPIDSRLTVKNFDGLNELFESNVVYDGLIVYCEASGTYMQFTQTEAPTPTDLNGKGVWQNLSGVLLSQNTAYNEDTETLTIGFNHLAQVNTTKNMDNITTELTIKPQN
jgi:hypothetical protein